MSEVRVGKKDAEPRAPDQMVALQVRFREDVRAELEASAKAAGRPMNAEIVDRLTLSLRDDAEYRSIATRSLLLELALQIARAEDMTGKQWNEDLATMIAAEHLIADTLRKARPQVAASAELQEIRAEIGSLTPRYRELRAQLEKCGVIEPESPYAQLMGSMEDVDPLPEANWHQPEQPSEELSDTEKDEVRELLTEWLDIHSLRRRIALAEAKAVKLYAANAGEAEARGSAIYDTIVGKIEVERGT